MCVFCKFCYLLEEVLVCPYSLSSPLRLSAAGWWVDRIPIATKGGKTAAGKDQIIHYTQQQGGKGQKDKIQKYDKTKRQQKRQGPDNTQHTNREEKDKKTKKRQKNNKKRQKRQRPDNTIHTTTGRKLFSSNLLES